MTVSLGDEKGAAQTIGSSAPPSTDSTIGEAWWLATDHVLRPWTENAAIVKADANGKATNTLTVKTAADSVRLFVNGAQVTALPRDHTGDPSGAVGLRVNHNLDVHVAKFEVTPAK